MPDIDNSSGALNLSTSPVGNTWRGIGSDWFNANAVAAEDWQRAEQSADNAFQRDLYQMQLANQFNASEAQKARDFEERLSNTSYQRAMADLKAAGLNPILAYQQGGASSPSSPAASSSSSGHRSGHRVGSRSGSDPLTSVVGSLLGFASGLLSGRGKTVSGYTDFVSDDKGLYQPKSYRSYDFKK